MCSGLQDDWNIRQVPILRPDISWLAAWLQKLDIPLRSGHNNGTSLIFYTQSCTPIHMYVYNTQPNNHISYIFLSGRAGICKKKKLIITILYIFLPARPIRSNNMFTFIPGRKWSYRCGVMWYIKWAHITNSTKGTPWGGEWSEAASYE